ncbi:MAG: GMC family oxidoreductase [Sedimentibacter sp.]
MINDIDRINVSFDYIIVGTGPAGCVLAKELSENGRNTVLLLEAGENNDNDILIRDSTANLNLHRPEYFWQGETVPQINANRKIFDWSTGRLSGGGSSINGEQFVRPSQYVLTEWESIAGPMWGPAAATRNFAMIENFNGKANNPEAHGFTGRLDIKQTPESVPVMTKKLVSAIEQGTGYKTILDYNDPNTPIGPFSRWQLTQKPNGERESASTAFLSQDVANNIGYGLNGRKLIIYYKTTALRILFNTNRDAVGIEFLKEGKCRIARALKKVIISAGINSTQLLMLSGIGPNEYLSKLNIPVIFNNPNVGQNLVNHTINATVFNVNPADIQEVLMEPDALYTGGAFLPSPNEINTNKRSIQLIGTYSNGALVILIVLLSPKSRGNIILQNNDPLKIVLANYNFLENSQDLELIKSVYKIYIKSIASALSAIDPKYQLVSPSMDIIDNDALLEQFIKDNLNDTHHQQSSLKMAPYNRGGVVDYLGRVYGVNNLIVADCSIIPSTTDGNTQSAAYLIGYTIAKQLLAEDQVRFVPQPYPNYPYYYGGYYR